MKEHCPLCNAELRMPAKLAELNLSLDGIKILSCPEKHYTIHAFDGNDLQFKNAFSNFVYIQDFELNRTYYEQQPKENRTTLWYKNKLLWEKDYCIDDDELVKITKELKSKSVLK